VDTNTKPAPLKKGLVLSTGIGAAALQAAAQTHHLVALLIFTLLHYLNGADGGGRHRGTRFACVRLYLQPFAIVHATFATAKRQKRVGPNKSEGNENFLPSIVIKKSPSQFQIRTLGG
jgi:hypothetical protein